MPFVMRDETAGINILHIDNTGQLGLGSLPNSGAAVTVQGTSLFDPTANLLGNLVGPGTGLTAIGSLSVPAGGSASISIAYVQTPTVSSDSPVDGSSPTSISWSNSGTTDLPVSYSLW